MAMNPGKFELGSTIITHYGFEERSLRAKRQYGMFVANGHSVSVARG